MQIFKKVKKKIHKKLLKYPAYVQILQIRDKVNKRLLAALLAFFDAISPLLIFLCINKPDTEENRNNGIMYRVII